MVSAMMKNALFALLLLAATSTTPQATVERFYTTYIAHKPAGLPSGKDLTRLRPFLSAKLAAAIDAANVYSKEYARKNPDDKPPFVDGDYFASLFEGPSSFKTAAAVQDGNAWKVPVRFKYENVHWTDTVVVTRENGKYVIDDVIFGGAGEFNPPGHLSARLQPEAVQSDASSPFAVAPGVSRAGSGNIFPLRPFPGDVQILTGDPEKEGQPFVMRINELPGTMIPVHSHPVDENITVVQGSWYFALGDTWKREALTELRAGDYAFAPKGSSMFGYCPDGAIVQIHGIGPFLIHWKHAAGTLDDAGASATFTFHKGDRVTSPRGEGIIRQGYASGDIIQYEIEPPSGGRFMANQSDVRRP